MRLSTSFALAALVALLASPAAAEGINLSWDDCGTNGQLLRKFSCETNAGAHLLVASFVVRRDIPELNGHEGVIEMQTNEAVLSDWWQLATGGCRAPLTSAFPASFDFATNTTCLNPWTSAVFGGTNFQPGFQAPNRARIRTVCAQTSTRAVTADQEYYVFKMTLSNRSSYGDGSCAGCADGACILFGYLKLTQPLVLNDNPILTNPESRRHVHWQPGGAFVGNFACPGSLPTHPATWGSIKSLYR